jgi:hypothetical protein
MRKLVGVWTQDTRIESKIRVLNVCLHTAQL